MKNKKEEKKSKKRRVLLALLMLLLTGVMTITSTYAWFTANKTVTVSTINVNVAASNGLQISVDGKNWKPVITTADLETVLANSEVYADNKNQLPAGNLSPVSTIGEIDGEAGTMKMFLGGVNTGEDGSYKLVSEEMTDESGTTGHYVVFDLFFQVTKAETLYLTSGSKVNGGEPDIGIQNAARVGFMFKGNTAAGSDLTVIQGLNTTTSNSNNKAIIWEPNNDKHKSTAIAHALSVYQKVITDGGDKVGYYGVKAEINGESAQALDSTNSTYFEQVEPNISTKFEEGISSEKYEKLFDLPAGISKVRVYMWVEGQDVDCEDNESGGAISFDLGFSINKSGE